MNFTAIDFETANRKRHSACSIGLAKVRDGKVVETFHELLYPDGEEFEKINISIHGITPEMVEGKKSLVTMWDEISEFIQDDVLVAHNVSFEQSVINQTLSAHGMPLPRNHYLCTMYMSKLNYPTRKGYRLPDLCREFLNKEVDHHNCLEDAVACAELAVYLIGLFPRQPLQSLISALYETPVREKTLWKDLKGITPSKDEFDQSDFWYGKTFVITGTLMSMRREDAIRILVDRGAIFGGNVTKKTDILIVGHQESVLIPLGQKSSKTIQAEKYISEGRPIQIMSEKEFSNLIAS